ncbi:MAG: replication endonuclease [Desulfobacteraceae bacterium]|nr:replication endonuclease [Desulfobacteraceae bacterium]MBC2750106.1 hypothetical protein [Desulfobacteraceae bacterium]
MREALSLDCIKNNSKFRQKREKPKCPNTRNYVEYADMDNKRVKFVPVSCKQWHCPVCGPRRLRELRSRARKAFTNILKHVEVKGFRKKYAIKMLTLTWPGRDRRNPSSSLIPRPEYCGEDTIEDAHREIKRNWNRLRTALKGKLGWFDQLWVVEPQQDGYPHLHVLLVGKNVVPKSILPEIRRLWCDKYGMGNVDLKPTRYFNDVNHAVNYITKYLTKAPSRLPKGLRLFGASKYILEKTWRPDPNRFQLISRGFFSTGASGNVSHIEPIWSFKSEIEIDLQQKAKKLGDWFLEQARKYRQPKLWLSWDEG